MVLEIFSEKNWIEKIEVEKRKEKRVQKYRYK